MFKEKFVVAVKHNGRVMREQGDTTYLPFGSEYSILLKNLNSVRAIVRVEIDGADVTGGVSLIVPANGSINLERFIEDGNFERGHRFKFIERTKKIEDGPRGIVAEDGLVRVEFEFEREPSKIVEHNRHIYHDYHHYPWTVPVRHYPWTVPVRAPVPWYGSISDILARGATLTSTAGVGSATYSANRLSANGASGDAEGVQAYFSNTTGEASVSSLAGSVPTMDSFAVAQNAAMPVNDVGITVKGSMSDQSFSHGAWFPTDGQKHVMILKLLGQVGEKKVEKPVTVKTKTECPTCGTKNAFGTKFCSECGTGLSLL